MKFLQILFVAAFMGLGLAAELQANTATCDSKDCPAEMCGTAAGNCDMPCCSK